MVHHCSHQYVGVCLCLTYDEGDGGLEVRGESKRTHRDVSALPSEGKEDRAKGLPHPRQEGGARRMENYLLFEKSQRQKSETSICLERGEETPVGGDTGRREEEGEEEEGGGEGKRREGRERVRRH